MIGPFKPTPRGFCWVYVCIDKFFKWIKYKPLVQATTKKAAKLLDYIIHRFGLPNSIITETWVPRSLVATSRISAMKDASQ
jgi:hypothetical protein